MQKTKNKRKYLTALAVTALTAGIYAAPATANPADMITNGTLYGDIRLRYEHVTDKAFPNRANALTQRTRLGFTTAEYMDFQANLEGEWVENLGTRRHNDTVNGKTQYPVIADPSILEVNQLWLSYTGLPDTAVKIGRQRINLDNQRFIGAVGWRQNDQTFDAAGIENRSIKNTVLSYHYIDRLHRIFGRHNAAGELNTKTHLARITHNHASWLNVTGYGYWIDIKRLPNASTQTFGLRLTGGVPLHENGRTLFYEAEAATQSDHGYNMNDYRESYYRLVGGIKQGGLNIRAGFESLGGNGTAAVQTPLATLHAHNGFTDKFLTTPVNGLQDFHGKISYRLQDSGTVFDNTVFDFGLHRFGAENGSAFYGSEWNMQISRNFPLPETLPLKQFSTAVKYADYNAKGMFADTRKFWLTIGTNF